MAPPPVTGNEPGACQLKDGYGAGIPPQQWQRYTPYRSRSQSPKRDLTCGVRKESAAVDLAFALLAPADPRAIAGLDHAGTRLDDLHSVVLHVVIRLKIRANLDAPGAST